MAEEKDATKQIEAIIGPYRGQRLSVTAADFDAAIAAHWAIDPFAEREDPDDPHPPLTEAERTAALEAANTWAQAQTGDVPEPPIEPPPPEGGATRRSMTPDESPGGYQTRQAPPAPRRR